VELQILAQRVIEELERANARSHGSRYMYTKAVTRLTQLCAFQWRLIKEHHSELDFKIAESWCRHVIESLSFWIQTPVQDSTTLTNCSDLTIIVMSLRRVPNFSVNGANFSEISINVLA
jgi:hypothetical protein